MRAGMHNLLPCRGGSQKFKKGKGVHFWAKWKKSVGLIYCCQGHAKRRQGCLFAINEKKGGRKTAPKNWGGKFFGEGKISSWQKEMETFIFLLVIRTFCRITRYYLRKNIGRRKWNCFKVLTREGEKRQNKAHSLSTDHRAKSLEGPF